MSILGPNAAILTITLYILHSQTIATKDTLRQNNLSNKNCHSLKLLVPTYNNCSGLSKEVLYIIADERAWDVEPKSLPREGFEPRLPEDHKFTNVTHKVIESFGHWPNFLSQNLRTLNFEIPGPKWTYDTSLENPK